MSDRPTIVCLCGSTRFKEAFEKANKEETLAGKIVLSVGMMGHECELDIDRPVKAMLDQLHFRKIEIADEVLVLNVLVRVCPKCSTKWKHDKIGVQIECDCGANISRVETIGYIGHSTRNEISHAIAQGKRVRYLNQPTLSPRYYPESQ